jgi:hypothetical protein
MASKARKQSQDPAREAIPDSSPTSDSYDSRVIGQFHDALGAKIYDARDPQTREPGSTKAFGDFSRAYDQSRYSTYPVDETKSAEGIYRARPGQKAPKADTVQPKEARGKGATTGKYRAGDSDGVKVVQ